jgi:hypothetical protein
MALFDLPVGEAVTLEEEVEAAVLVADDPAPVAVTPNDVVVPAPIAAEI